ncbi:MAG: FAD-dependent oxidoreductase [Firmicutes bacterium]|nr:FAD-dependent oxidoreductase [Bacillota bacterium]
MATEYDVIVVGGGLTGTAAALAAARGGMRVLLAEQSGALGGAACTCLVNPFMPYSTTVHTAEHPEGEPFVLSRGIFEEILNRLREIGNEAIHGRTFNEEYLKLILDHLVEEAGVEVLFHAFLCGVEKNGERLRSVSFATKAGVLSLPARCFIDATGDADLAVMSGCPWHLGRAEDSLCQPMTLCFRLGGIDTEEFFARQSEIQKVYREWQETGKTENPRENVLPFRTLNRGVVHFNTTRVVRLNPVDPFEVSRAERMARRQMLELFHMLKENLDFCRNAELLMSAAQIGVRESRMIDGEHLLTGEELKACTRFPDAIAAGNYDIDIHNPEGSGTSHYYFPEGAYYTIPYRSLQPKDTENLLVAGRCISCTHEAQASCRIMPIVTCLGEAAGTAAAIACRANLPFKKIDIAELQNTLQKNGAFLGI